MDDLSSPTGREPALQAEPRADGSPPRALVLGGTGYIGGRLVPRLLAAGYRVRLLARDARRVAAFPWGERVEVVEGTATDVDALTEMNFRFHLAISQAAHSRHLHHGYERALIEGMRVGHVSFIEHDGTQARLQEHLDRTIADHREMVSFIRDQDTEGAERVATRHVELFRNRIVTTVLSPDATRRVQILN